MTMVWVSDVVPGQELVLVNLGQRQLVTVLEKRNDEVTWVDRVTDKAVSVPTVVVAYQLDETGEAFECPLEQFVAHAYFRDESEK